MAEKWRARSPENVVAEFRHLIKDLGAEEIGILDDSANISRKRLYRISELLIQEGLTTVPWIMINGIRANLADKELLSIMKKAGCKRTAFGVETGNEGILKSIDKRVTHEQIRQAFKNAKEVGLETVGFFIRPPGRHRRNHGADHSLCLRAGSFGGQLLHDDPLSGD